MRPSPFTTVLAVLLTITLIAPTAFLSAPQKVHAQEGVWVFGDSSVTNIKTMVESTISAIRNTLTAANTATTAWATTAAQINTYVLQPLAFVMSGNLLKLITAGVISFVIGKANGTGVPQFVVDVQKSMQTVGDAKALAFFDQFGRNSNSPFAGSIVSSLRNDYLSKTSLAGFWAANMNTLARSTPSYRPGFLAGNWQQGGIAAWFALTTQTQNNPYTLAQNAQSQLGTLIGPGVGGATGARLAQLGWGQGFTSWCGANDGFLGSLTTGSSAFGAAYNAAQAAHAAYGAAVDAAADDPNNPALKAAVVQAKTADDAATVKQKAVTTSSSGVNPGDPCTNSDGTSGTIKTPGSVIVAALNKALGTDQDRIVRMGNVGPEINNILKNVSTVLNTVNFASQILGGPGSGGLFGVDSTSATNPTSRLVQFQATPSLGVTNSTVYENTSTLPISGGDMSSRVAQYQSAWSTIASVANTASSSVSSLISYCNAQASGGVSAPTIAAAQAALATEIVPIFTQVSAASTTAAAANAMVLKVQQELASGTDTTGSAYSADVLALQTMPPTTLDVANAQQDAQAFGVAAASPAGSLTVSGGSILDRMNLISANAVALKASCVSSSVDWYQPSGP